MKLQKSRPCSAASYLQDLDEPVVPGPPPYCESHNRFKPHEALLTLPSFTEIEVKLFMEASMTGAQQEPLAIEHHIDSSTQAHRLQAEQGSPTAAALPQISPDTAPVESPPALLEHVVQLKRKYGGCRLAALRLNYACKSRKGVPLFIPGDTIRGTIELDIRDPRSIKKISVSLHGSMSDYDSFSPNNTPEPKKEYFLKISATLWRSRVRVTDPRPFSEKTDASIQYLQTLPPSQLKFAITLPECTIFNGKREDLPPSMSDLRGWSGKSFEYKISVVVKTRFLQRSCRLKCPIDVTPVVHIPSVFPLRRSPQTVPEFPPGPQTEPSRWIVSEAQICAIRLFGTIVYLQYQLSLVKPTVYASGGNIALQLLLEAPDTSDRHQQALCMLGKPSCVSVCLVHTIFDVIENSNDSSLSGDQKRIVSKTRAVRRRTLVAMGTCWMDHKSKAHSGKIVINGEIAVPNGLIPSFSFQNLHAEYSVLIPAISAPGIETLAKGYLVEMPITLVRGQSHHDSVSFAPKGSKPPPPMDLEGSCTDSRLKSVAGVGWQPLVFNRLHGTIGGRL